MDSIDAEPSGCLFSDWIARRGCSKSTAYRMRNELGIAPEKRRNGTSVEVWLTAKQERLMDDYAEALRDGLSIAEALSRVGSPIPMDSIGAMTRVPRPDPMDSIEPEPASPSDSDGSAENALLQLRRRLAALRDAVDLGAPLSTAEVALLLGARPGGSEVVRGRIRAVRQRRNVWTIEPD